MTASSQRAIPLARLSFWVPAARPDDFAETYDRQLTPLLKEHGLENSFPGERPLVPGIFSRLFELESVFQVTAKTRALQRDPAWQTALRAAESRLDFTGSGQNLRYRFDLYSAPAGPGETLPAGPGFRQGLWRSYGVQDGLPYAVVDILEDREGHLWFATGWPHYGGVSRFDGIQFTTYTTADGLVHDAVNSLLEDRQGNLWFATDRGVSRFDGKEFISFTTADGLVHDAVNSLLEDRQGNLWFATDRGVSRFDGKEFTSFTTADGLVHDAVNSLLEDRQGNLWFATGNRSQQGGGVSRYDGENWTTFTTADGLGSDTILSLLEDRQGQLWVGTHEGGASRFDDERFVPVDALEGEDIGAIAADADGHLWFTTGWKGVRRFDGEHWIAFTVADGLANDQVGCIAVDRQGQLWFGTLSGVSRFDSAHFTHFTARDGLAHNGVMSLLEDRQGNLWVGTWEGVSRFDGTRLTRIDPLADWHVWSLLEDRQGNLWFGGAFGEGLMRYDGNRFTLFTTDDGLAHNNVFSLLEDRQGNMWIGTREGVSRFDGTRFTPFTTDDGLAGNWGVHDILEDHRGNLWFATNGAVSRFDGQTFATFTAEQGLVHGAVHDILEDRQGNLWFAADGGVSRFDGQTFATFTAEQGLVHAHVNDILEDRQGTLWFATFGGGVGRYDGRVFQHLSRQDGLVFDVVQALLQDRRGDIWIGTEGGVTRYRPDRNPPAVQLQAVVADRRHDPAGEIRIPVSQQLVSFEFQGRSWTTPPERMAYLCRLDGHDADWRPVYGGRIEYQTLDPGDYTFQVKAVDRDLNYSSPAEVRISIEPDLRLEGWKEALGAQDPAREFVGTSPALRQVQTQLAQVAPTDVTVLILGDTGTGKGLAARMLHQFSDRRDSPFFPINCGSLPSGLVESELFGHEQGAFTGATRRKLGKVELAEGGTLFLDEIGDLPREAQVKLLHFLEERTFERVGGTQTLTADVRVATATNRNLPEMVAEGSFREDLYFRLQVFKVELPRLRERREDIPQLAHYFMERMATHLGKPVRELTPEALEILRNYDWPGNVRELEHGIEQAVIVCPGPVIRPEDIALEQSHTEKPAAAELLSLEEIERRHIRSVLEHTSWVISGAQGAAAVLGLHEATLRYRMKKLGIKRPTS